MAVFVENENAMFERLAADGWNLCPEKVVTEIEEFDKLAPKVALEELKNSDLKHIGVACFPEEASKAGKLDRLEGPLVAQVQKVRNVAAPKANEDSHVAPRMLKLTLTDGVSSLVAIEMETINHISLNTPPGTKIQLLGQIPVRQGYLQLSPSNVKVLGGSVLKLIEKWEANRLVEMTGRVYTGQEGGPPPFVGFGKQRSTSSGVVDTTRPAFPMSGSDGTRAASGGGRRDSGSVEDKDQTTSTFEQQRDEALQEAMKAKAAEPKKSFGGSKTWVRPQPLLQQPQQQQQQQSPQQTTEISALMVATPNIANFSSSSDKRSKSGEENASNAHVGSTTSRTALRRDSDSGANSTSFIGGGKGSFDAESFATGRGGGRGRGRGGRGGGFHQRDFGSDGGGEDGRPSGPATLFDFLETKFPTNKAETGSKSLPSKTSPAVGGNAENNSDAKRKSQGFDYHASENSVDLSVTHFPPPPTSAGANQPPTKKANADKLPSPTHIPRLQISRKPDAKSDDKNGAGESNAREVDDGDGIDASELVDGKKNEHQRPKTERQDSKNSAGEEGVNGQKPFASENESGAPAPRDKGRSVDENSKSRYPNRGQPPMRSFNKPMPPFPPPHRPPFRGPMGNPMPVATGDAVLAKYWEDGGYYVAIINQLAKTTAVVTFLKPYGNTEEVYLSDLMTFDGHPVFVGRPGTSGDRRRSGDSRFPSTQISSGPHPPPLTSLAVNASGGPPSRQNQAFRQPPPPNMEQPGSLPKQVPPKPKSSGPLRQFLLPDVHQPPPNFTGPPPLSAPNAAPVSVPTVVTGSQERREQQPPPPSLQQKNSTASSDDDPASMTNALMATQPTSAPSQPTMGPSQPPPLPLLHPPLQPPPLLPVSTEQELSAAPIEPKQSYPSHAMPTQQSPSVLMPVNPLPQSLPNQPPPSQQQQQQQQQPQQQQQQQQHQPKSSFPIHQHQQQQQTTQSAPTISSVPPPTSVPPPPFNASAVASSGNMSPSMSIPPQTMMTASYPPPHQSHPAPIQSHPSLQFTPPSASMATLPPELASQFMQGVPPGCAIPAWLPSPVSGVDYFGGGPNGVSLPQPPFNLTSLSSTLPHPAAFGAPQQSFPVRANAHHPNMIGATPGSFAPPPPSHPTTPTLAPVSSQPMPPPGVGSMEDYVPPAPRFVTAPMAPVRPQQMFQHLYPRMAQGASVTTAMYK